MESPGIPRQSSWRYAVPVDLRIGSDQRLVTGKPSLPPVLAELNERAKTALSPKRNYLGRRGSITSQSAGNEVVKALA